MMSLTNWNRLLYAAWAPFYDVLVFSLESKRRKSLELASVLPTEKVLLIGAGTGLDLKYLPRQADITAVDLTPAMIRRLQARAQNLEMEVDAQVMDAQSLTFPDNSFDVVILHFVLAVIPDPVMAIREVNRVLRPGGRAVILNKFVKDGSKPSISLRLTNKLVRLLATDITCQLGPIAAVSGMQKVYEQEIGPGGFFKIAILVKEPKSHLSSFSVNVSPEHAASSSPDNTGSIGGLSLAGMDNQ